MNSIKLIPLEDRDRDQFILDNQEAFNFGAIEDTSPKAHSKGIGYAAVSKWIWTISFLMGCLDLRKL